MKKISKKLATLIEEGLSDLLEENPNLAAETIKRCGNRHLDWRVLALWDWSEFIGRMKCAMGPSFIETLFKEACWRAFLDRDQTFFRQLNWLQKNFNEIGRAEDSGRGEFSKVLDAYCAAFEKAESTPDIRQIREVYVDLPGVAVTTDKSETNRFLKRKLRSVGLDCAPLPPGRKGQDY